MQLWRRTRVGLVAGLFLWGALALCTALNWMGRFAPDGQIEVAAVIFSGASVWLAVKNSILTWPAGIVGTALYLYLFWNWGLFADAGLQAVYIALGFVGIWTWRRRLSGPEPAQADRASAAHVAAVLVAVCAGTIAIREYLLMAGGSAPLLDALLTSGSLGAQYLLIRKYIQTWHLWAVVDVGYIALFADRGFYLSAALYVVFLVMVMRAAVAWRALLVARPALSGSC